MDKPDNHSTLKYMKLYIKDKKLNEKPIKLNLKRADTIEHLKKLGHWDSSKDGIKKPKKTDGVDKAKGSSQKRVTVGKEAPAKKRLDEYVKLHTLYINTFDNAGLKKYKSVATAKRDSDKLLKRMDELVEPISQILITDYIKKNQKVIGLKKKVKDIKQSLAERSAKEDEVRPAEKSRLRPVKKAPAKKPAPKEDEVRPVDKDVDTPPTARNSFVNRLRMLKLTEPEKKEIREYFKSIEKTPLKITFGSKFRTVAISNEDGTESDAPFNAMVKFVQDKKLTRFFVNVDANFKGRKQMASVFIQDASDFKDPDKKLPTARYYMNIYTLPNQKKLSVKEKRAENAKYEKIKESIMPILSQKINNKANTVIPSLDTLK